MTDQPLPPAAQAVLDAAFGSVLDRFLLRDRQSTLSTRDSAMTINLSLAAQAVYNAVLEICPAPADEIAAAALRAAADQVVPETNLPIYASPYEEGIQEARQDVREGLLAIAAELDNTSQPSQ